MRRNDSFVNSYRQIYHCGNNAVAKKSLLEVYGQSRVLIENHAGILSYDHDLISVRVVFGCVQIHGARLKLKLLSKEKLIITGEINSITLKQECTA